VKRSRLHRKTPIKRISAKRRKQMARTKSQRDSFRAEFRICMLCSKRKATDVHEIVTRAKSDLAVENRCTWLCLCRTCHDREVADYGRYPVSRQLALKLVADPEAFDLAKVNELRGNDPNEFTLADVVRWLDMKC
jgi:hypothetical protein